MQAEERLARTNDAVQAVAADSGASPALAKYHIEVLARVTAAIAGAPAGSAERHVRRATALAMAVDLVERGSCTATEPYELALRLLEVEEEVAAHTPYGQHSTTGEIADPHAPVAVNRLPSNGVPQRNPIMPVQSILCRINLQVPRREYI